MTINPTIHCHCPSDAPDAMDMWRHHNAGADREEAHPLHGDPLQTASTLAEVSREAATTTSGQERGQAPGTKSVQAGKRTCPPRLGKKQRGQEDPSSPLPDTDDRILGHSHLTLTRNLDLPITQPPYYPLPLPVRLY